MTDNKVIYHGGKEIIRFPEIRPAKYNKDFYFDYIVPISRNKPNVGQHVMAVLE